MLWNSRMLLLLAAGLGPVAAPAAPAPSDPHSEQARDQAPSARAPNQAKNDQAKNDQAKNDQAKNDQAKNDQAKNDQAKNDQAKNDQAKNDRPPNQAGLMADHQTRYQASALGVELTVTAFALENGLRVFVTEDHSVPALAVHAAFGVGTRDEAAQCRDCARRAERLMVHGSADGSGGRFLEAVREAGGNTHATTTAARTGFQTTLPSHYLERIVWLESQRLGQAHKAVRAAAEAAATDSDLEGFFAEHYAPGNAVLAIAGDVTFDAVRAAVRSSYADLALPTPPAVPRPAREAPDEARNIHGRFVLTWTALPRGHADRPALALLMAMLVDGLAPADEASPAEVHDAVQAELAALKRRGVIDRALAKAKNHASVALMTQLSTNEGRAQLLARGALRHGDPVVALRELDAALAVTPADIERVAGTHLTDTEFSLEVAPNP